jgi:hypothetical protein
MLSFKKLKTLPQNDIHMLKNKKRPTENRCKVGIGEKKGSARYPACPIDLAGRYCTYALFTFGGIFVHKKRVTLIFCSGTLRKIALFFEIRKTLKELKIYDGDLRFFFLFFVGVPSR